MSLNRKFTLKQGAVGSVMHFTLFDEDGPIDLTGYTVTLTCRKNGQTAVIDAVECTVNPDQTTNPGQGTFTFDVTTSAIPIATYNLEFKAVNGGNTYYFPTHREAPFGELYVVANLDA